MILSRNNLATCLKCKNIFSKFGIEIKSHKDCTISYFLRNLSLYFTDFHVCVNLCDCGSTADRHQVNNKFHCTGKHSADLLNNIPTTTTDL